MLQRFAIHLALIFIFAITQIGVATHEISHLSDAGKHSQHDKNAPTEQCEQCISYAKVASGLELTTFSIPDFTASFATATVYPACFQSRLNTAYAARAPPQITSI